MPAVGWCGDGHLWLRFYLPFLLDKKGRKNQGRHQRPAALGGRPSAMSAVARAPNPVEGGRSLMVVIRQENV